MGKIKTHFKGNIITTKQSCKQADYFRPENIILNPKPNLKSKSCPKKSKS